MHVRQVQEVFLLSALFTLLQAESSCSTSDKPYLVLPQKGTSSEKCSKPIAVFSRGAYHFFCITPNDAEPPQAELYSILGTFAKAPGFFGTLPPLGGHYMLLGSLDTGTTCVCDRAIFLQIRCPPLVRRAHGMPKSGSRLDTYRQGNKAWQPWLSCCCEFLMTPSLLAETRPASVIFFFDCGSMEFLLVRLFSCTKEMFSHVNFTLCWLSKCDFYSHDRKTTTILQAWTTCRRYLVANMGRFFKLIDDIDMWLQQTMATSFLRFLWHTSVLLLSRCITQEILICQVKFLRVTRVIDTVLTINVAA